MWQRGVECDGKCYTDEGICPRAEWCDKTRKGEFAATALAGFFFLVVLVMLVPGMIALKLLAGYMENYIGGRVDKWKKRRYG